MVLAMSGRLTLKRESWPRNGRFSGSQAQARSRTSLFPRESSRSWQAIYPRRDALSTCSLVRLLTIRTLLASLLRMESLHAPWRIRCTFRPSPLRLVTPRSSRESPSLVMMKPITWSSGKRTCFALLNTYPYNGGHLLVVPYKQTASLGRFDRRGTVWFDEINSRRCQRSADEVDETGWIQHRAEFGKGGRGGDYRAPPLPFVPRWAGDTNFMPMIANTSGPASSSGELAANCARSLTRAEPAPRRRQIH